MRIFSLIIAVLVMLSLYLVIFERDRLVEFAGGTMPAEMQGSDAPAAPETTAAAEPATEPGATAPQADAPRIVPVTVMRSTARELDSAVILRGRTEAARQVEVRAETTSTVVSDPLRKGAYVEEGQLLCKLDVGTRDASVAEAQAALASAEIEMTQASKLSQEGYASQTRLISARAAQQRAQGALSAAEKEIERLEIRAPFAGLLETDTAEIGSFLPAGGLCATVIQLDPIKLVGFAPEADVDRIEVGALAGAQLVSGRQVTGRVTFLSRAADQATRTFRVEIELPNPDLSIRDGQTVEMAISSDGRQAHLLPQSALTLDDGGDLGVRLVDEDSKAKFAAVQVVRDTRDGIWVTGLPDQAVVIVVGQEYVVDGVSIAPTFREETQ